MIKKMTFIRMALLSLTLFALTSCFKEDYSFCPPEENNVTLHYRLPDGSGGCTFLRDIAAVTTAIYDQAGMLVRTVTTTAADHNDLKGIRLTLDPGTYRVISWANSGGNTALGDIASCYTAAPSITYKNITAGQVGDGDALYYAPNTARTRSGNEQGEYVMTVGSDGHEGTLDFRNAHRRIEVFVRGFSGTGGSTTPAIELTGLPPGLTFLGMGKLAGSALVDAEIASQTITVNEGGADIQYALAAFNVFHFHAADYDIGIVLKDPAGGNVVYTTRLNEHINPLTDNPDKIVLQLVLTFKNGTVTVTIPGWNSGDVDYGIFD